MMGLPEPHPHTEGQRESVKTKYAPGAQASGGPGSFNLRTNASQTLVRDSGERAVSMAVHGCRSHMRGIKNELSTVTTLPVQ